MSILKHLDKKKLHHAYLIEGERDEIMPEILSFFESLNIKTFGNPDFCHIIIDNLKIEEAFDLRAMSSDKSFSLSKKVFIICVNSLTLDAQNVLLKMFEEPIENTHFFVVVPDADSLLKTLVSRFYFIRNKNVNTKTEDVEKFIGMSLQKRIDFIKELLIEPKEDEESNEIVALDSTRSKALKFLNALESVLCNKLILKTPLDIVLFEHFLKVREFLRMPGSSVKTLMESVALIIPML